MEEFRCRPHDSPVDTGVYNDHECVQKPSPPELNLT